LNWRLSNQEWMMICTLCQVPINRITDDEDVRSWVKFNHQLNLNQIDDRGWTEAFVRSFSSLISFAPTRSPTWLAIVYCYKCYWFLCVYYSIDKSKTGTGTLANALISTWSLIAMSQQLKGISDQVSLHLFTRRSDFERVLREALCQRYRCLIIVERRFCADFDAF
jgi:hypothetical protein